MAGSIQSSGAGCAAGAGSSPRARTGVAPPDGAVGAGSASARLSPPSRPAARRRPRPTLRAGHHPCPACPPRTRRARAFRGLGRRPPSGPRPRPRRARIRVLGAAADAPGTWRPTGTDAAEALDASRKRRDLVCGAAVRLAGPVRSRSRIRVPDLGPSWHALDKAEARAANDPTLLARGGLTPRGRRGARGAWARASGRLPSRAARRSRSMAAVARPARAQGAHPLRDRVLHAAARADRDVGGAQGALLLRLPAQARSRWSGEPDAVALARGDDAMAADGGCTGRVLGRGQPPGGERVVDRLRAHRLVRITAASPGVLRVAAAPARSPPPALARGVRAGRSSRRPAA